MKLQIYSECVVGALDEGMGSFPVGLWAETLLYSAAPVHRGPYCPNIDSAWLSDVTSGLRNELLRPTPVSPVTFLLQLEEIL